MRNKELQVKHDEIWNEIYERQKRSLQPNVSSSDACICEDAEPNSNSHLIDVDARVESNAQRLPNAK